MHHSSRRRRRPRRAPPPARTAAAVRTTIVLALLAAACSASPSPAGTGGSPDAGGSASSPSAIGYSACMRSHGVPDFPDPGSSGQVPKTSAQQLGVSSSRYQAAQQACQRRYPASGGSFQQSIQQCEETGDCPQAVVQQALNVMRQYARCMRAHGVPNWPDPTTDSRGRPYFDLSGHGFSRQQAHSPQISRKGNECERLVGGSAGVPVPMG